MLLSEDAWNKKVNEHIHATRNKYPWNFSKIGQILQSCCMFKVDIIFDNGDRGWKGWMNRG
jgi:hypothetical protein